MVPEHALFPGTFDPPTLGHLDLIRRAREVFERVTIAVAEHPSKAPIFTVSERVELLRALAAEFEGVDVVRLEGLVVDGCRSVGAGVVVRGVRNGADFDYEARMAATNRELEPDVETLFLAASPGVSHIASTHVRQIAAMGGDVKPFVPVTVAAALRAKFPGSAG